MPRFRVPFLCRTATAIPVLLVLAARAPAQSLDLQDPITLQRPPVSQAQVPETAPPASGATDEPVDQTGGQQTKRILDIVPNFGAVSANAQPPPLSPRQKFWLATEGSFDYSSFISVAIQSAVEEATKTYPEFGQGGVGYGRYYWHAFADSVVENYFVGAIFPVITHEDPRYYTLYHGSVPRRVIYAFSRLWKTRNDKGAPRFNFSEILGAGVATEVSGRYYPAVERGGGRETLERWGSQMLNDGIGNIFQEFWPDIHHKFFTKH
jgi:hypothetical protein